MFLETWHVTGHLWQVSSICPLPNLLALTSSNILTYFKALMKLYLGYSSARRDLMHWQLIYTADSPYRR